MSTTLPGLGHSEAHGRIVIDVGPGQEWPFDVDAHRKIIVKLVAGKAEIFGTELALGREYDFRNYRAAVYSWGGCKLECTGTSREEVKENPVMGSWANLHFALEKKHKAGEPLRALIIGPPKSGKTSLAKLLCSYAYRQGRYPTFLNLDPQTPAFVPPGALTATPISHILDLENGWGSAPVNGPSPAIPMQPLVYNYGLATTQQSPEAYYNTTLRLMEGVNKRLEQDKQLSDSGMIIDTPAEVPELQKLIDILKVDLVVSLHEEDIALSLPVIRLKPSPGAKKDEDGSFTRACQRNAIAEYFFGSPRQVLSPFTITVRLNTLVVYRVVEEKEYAAEEGKLLKRIEPSSVIQNCLLAVANASISDPPEVVGSAETLGYIHVVEAADNKRDARLLLPVPGKLPQRPFIVGDFRYHE